MSTIHATSVNKLMQVANECTADGTLARQQIYLGTFDSYVMGLPETIDTKHPDTQFLLEQFCALSQILIEHKQRFLPLIARKMLQYLVDENISNKLMSITKGPRVLGWFIMTQAAKLYRHPDTKHAARLRDLVCHVTGEELGRYQNQVLEEVVTNLYGAACWSLYGHNYKNEDGDVIDIALATEIYSAGIPLQVEHKNKLDLITSLSPLPDTLSP